MKELLAQHGGLAAALAGSRCSSLLVLALASARRRSAREASPSRRPRRRLRVAEPPASSTARR